MITLFLTHFKYRHFNYFLMNAFLLLKKKVIKRQNKILKVIFFLFLLAENIWRITERKKTHKQAEDTVQKEKQLYKNRRKKSL